MNRMSVKLILVFLGVISGCASINDKEVGGAPMFALSIADNVEQMRFDLVLLSQDSRPLCMDVEQWPNAAGQVDWHGRKDVLMTEEGTYSAQDANFGYCPGGCGVITIQPGEKHTGFIPYSEFGDSSEIASLHGRKLAFTVLPRICKL